MMLAKKTTKYLIFFFFYFYLLVSLITCNLSKLAILSHIGVSSSIASLNSCAFTNNFFDYDFGVLKNNLQIK